MSDDTIKKNISKNISKYREAKKMSQKELAQRLGVVPSRISNWETGANCPTIDILFKVCDVLEVSINDIYGVYPDSKFILQYDEQELIKKYRELDQYGKDTVNMILEREHQKCVDYTVQLPNGNSFILEQRPYNEDKSETKKRLEKYCAAFNSSPLPDLPGNSPMGPETDEMCYQIEQAKKKNLHYLNSYTDLAQRDAVIKAAHNDSSDPAEIEKMMQDLENLKRPE